MTNAKLRSVEFQLEARCYYIMRKKIIINENLKPKKAKILALHHNRQKIITNESKISASKTNKKI